MRPFSCSVSPRTIENCFLCPHSLSDSFRPYDRLPGLLRPLHPLVSSTEFGPASPSYRLPLSWSDLFNAFTQHHVEILFSFSIGYQSRPFIIIHSLEHQCCFECRRAVGGSSLSAHHSRVLIPLSAIHNLVCFCCVSSSSNGPRTPSTKLPGLLAFPARTLPQKPIPQPYTSQ